MNLASNQYWKVRWYSGKDTVGVVLIKNELDKYQVYIGVAQLETEFSDAQYIADWGAKLTFMEAKGFFPELKKGEYNGY